MTLTDYIRKNYLHANLERLQELAWRALHIFNLPPTEFFVICIEVDDPSWRELVDVLMPDEDWQKYRDLGQTPFARGSVLFKTVGEYIMHTVPALADLKTSQYMNEVNENNIIAIVCGAGGASAYMIEPKNEGN